MIVKLSRSLPKPIKPMLQTGRNKGKLENTLKTQIKERIPKYFDGVDQREIDSK